MLPGSWAAISVRFPKAITSSQAGIDGGCCFDMQAAESVDAVGTPVAAWIRRAGTPLRSATTARAWTSRFQRVPASTVTSTEFAAGGVGSSAPSGSPVQAESGPLAPMRMTILPGPTQEYVSRREPDLGRGSVRTWLPVPSSERSTAKPGSPDDGNGAGSLGADEGTAEGDGSCTRGGDEGALEYRSVAVQLVARVVPTIARTTRPVVMGGEGRAGSSRGSGKVMLSLAVPSPPRTVSPATRWPRRAQGVPPGHAVSRADRDADEISGWPSPTYGPVGARPSRERPG